MGSSRDERLRDLAHRYVPEVAKYLHRRSYPLPSDEIDDLVEEVLVVTWRRLDDAPVGRELPWMIGIARNVLNNARRKHSQRASLNLKVEPRAPHPSAEDQMIAEEQLRVALARLSNRDREALLLTYWEGLDIEGLARVLSISTNAASVRLSRASSRLRADIEGT